MYAIQTMGLVKRYDKLTAVDGLQLEIKRGELFSLLGVNGAGKTTTIKMLTGLTKPTDGDAVVGGCSISEEPERVKHLIGVSPQETAVAPNLSVKENLELICGIHGFSKEKTRAKCGELSAQFGLDSVLQRKAGKQVGGICGALLTNLSAWLSGVWFDLHLVGGFFERIANILPFVHAAEVEKALFGGNFELAASHILPIVLYAVLITAAAVCCFLVQMKKQ